MGSPLLGADEAAAYLGCTPAHLRHWRTTGEGPRYVRMGNSKRCQIRYTLDDLEAWVDAKIGPLPTRPE